MPEVVIGLALLLLFVAIDIERGFLTVVIAHATLGMCFVTVIVYARLATFDRSLEEAAMDLGASPLATFFLVTLPLLARLLRLAFCSHSPFHSTISYSRALRRGRAQRRCRCASTVPCASE